MSDRQYPTAYPQMFADLARPFEDWEVKVKPAQGGRQLHYITARTAMNRLDEVLGPENWWDEYVQGEKSVVCRLTIRLPEDGGLLTKTDAGGYAGMADAGDDEKSGFSDAFKRACAKFGLGRYLYQDGVPNFVREIHPAGEPQQPQRQAPQPQPQRQAPQQYQSQQQDRQGYQRAPQQQHQQQRPQGNGQGYQQPQNNGYQGNNGGGNGGGQGNDQRGNNPRTGKALFAWTKDMEQQHEVGLLKYINGWAKLQELPSRMIDWDAEQVQLAHQEMLRKIQSIQPGRDEAYQDALAN